MLLANFLPQRGSQLPIRKSEVLWVPKRRAFIHQVDEKLIIEVWPDILTWPGETCKNRKKRNNIIKINTKEVEVPKDLVVFVYLLHVTVPAPEWGAPLPPLLSFYIDFIVKIFNKINK